MYCCCVYFSDNDHAALSIGVSSGHAAGAYIGRDESLIEGICVWVVDVVIDTCVVVEAGWLPEFLHVRVGMVIIEQEHGSVANQEEAQEVGLETRVEGLEVRAILGVALVAEDLSEAIEGASVGHLSVGEWAHGVKSCLNHIERHSCKCSNEASDNC